MDGLEHVEDVPDRLLDVAQEALPGALAQAGPVPRALGLRVQLTGTCSVAYDDIRKWIAGP